MARTNQVIEMAWDEAQRAMTFVVKGAKGPELVLHTKKMTAEDNDRAYRFGIGQKVSNAAAKSRVIRNGVEVNATPQGKYDAMKRVIDSLESGKGWNPGRDPDRIGVDETILSQAMALAFPQKTAEEIRAKVVSSTKEQRKALTLDPRIEPHYERLMGEYTADVDTEELLAGW